MPTKIKLYGIKENGEKGRVIKIVMGQSFTYITLENHKKSYNSIEFVKFVDENGNEINIYKDFNPYNKGKLGLDLDGVTIDIDMEEFSIPTSITAKDSLKTTGTMREFPSGSKRDSTEGKPPMELLPWELLERLAFHYGRGAKEYGENNWRMGQPDSAVLGSVHRHISKYTRNQLDEDHLAAAIWGLLTLMNNQTYHQDNPLIRDILDWYDENGKPTGKGSYKQKLKDE